MVRIAVQNSEYFRWLCDKIGADKFAGSMGYSKLLLLLHQTSFKALVQRDENRAEDGLECRYRYSLTNGYHDIPSSDVPCTVLEMMVGLSLRCEESIMDDPSKGDRTGQWFWGMINSLGLSDMYDQNFDERHVGRVIDDFLNRNYQPNGKGGLFTIHNCEYDLRDVEIWYQLCWYLNSIV